MRKLTTKQQLFACYFVKYGNSTYSAKKAGYSKRSARQIGSRLISTDYIQNYIHERISYVKSNAIASADEILKYYTKVLRGKVTEDDVKATTDDVVTVKKRPDISERTKAATELMKRYAPIEKAKARKLNAEAKLKELTYNHSSVSDNRVIDNSCRLLDKLEKYGKEDYQKQNN